MPPQIPTQSMLPNHPYKVFVPMILIVVGSVLVAGMYLMTPRGHGNVQLLVIGEDGQRTLGQYSLSSNKFTAGNSGDAMAVGTRDEYILSDESVITLSFSGIVRKFKNGAESILVLTAVVPSDRTPLAVGNNGQLLAWVNPADNSLQVFERNSRGVYLPLYTSKDKKVSSLGFTDDGSALLIAKVVVPKGGGNAETELTVVTLTPAGEKSLGTLNGFVSIVTP